MKRMILWWIIGALILGVFDKLVFGQQCPEQEFMRIDANEVDVNDIVIDPESGMRLLRAVASCRVSQTVTFEVSPCDPDGDEMTVYAKLPGANAVVLTPDPNTGKYLVAYTPSAPGRYYITVGATDGQDVREGSYVVNAIANRAPVLMPGLVTISRWGGSHESQRRLVAISKYQPGILMRKFWTLVEAP